MSGRTIKRGGKGVRRAAAAQGKALKVRSAKAKTGSLFDTVMSWLPFSEAQLHRIFLAMILGIVAVGAWMAASFAGIPALARDQGRGVIVTLGAQGCDVWQAGEHTHVPGVKASAFSGAKPVGSPLRKVR